MYILGLDTSGYTTSLAAVDGQGQIAVDERILLKVKRGERGLRQSEALFQHLQNLPLLMDKAGKTISLKETCALAASLKPRPLESSYMPVFRVGESFARSFSSLLEVPFYPTTHQEGHLWSALYSLYTSPLKRDYPERFLALHLSGGTTELLQVTRKENFLNIEILGGTSDLPLGQFIDRMGVKMGLSFPCGPHLEKLARGSKNPEGIPVSLQGNKVSYSGPLTHGEKLLKKGAKREDLARGIEISAARSLTLLIKQVIQYNPSTSWLLVTGGVASNSFIRKYMEDNLRSVVENLHFTPAKLSGDNGVGVAFYGWNRFNLKNY